MDCLFCKIAAGEIPSKPVYRDDLVLARLGENTRLLGGLFETAQRALDRFARRYANFH